MMKKVILSLLPLLFAFLFAQSQSQKVQKNKNDRIELIFPQYHKGEILSFDISEDNNYALTSSSDNTVKVWDLKLGICITNINLPTRFASKSILAKYKNRIIALIASNDGLSYAIDAFTGNKISSFKNGSEEIVDIDYHKNNETVITTSKDGWCYEWKIDNGKLVKKYHHGNGYYNSSTLIYNNTIYNIGSHGFIQLFDNKSQFYFKLSDIKGSTFNKDNNYVKDVRLNSNNSLIIKVENSKQSFVINYFKDQYNIINTPEEFKSENYRQTKPIYAFDIVKKDSSVYLLTPKGIIRNNLKNSSFELIKTANLLNGKLSYKNAVVLMNNNSNTLFNETIYGVDLSDGTFFPILKNTQWHYAKFINDNKLVFLANKSIYIYDFNSRKIDKEFKIFEKGKIQNDNLLNLNHNIIYDFPKIAGWNLKTAMWSNSVNFSDNKINLYGEINVKLQNKFIEYCKKERSQYSELWQPYYHGEYSRNNYLTAISDKTNKYNVFVYYNKEFSLWEQGNDMPFYNNLSSEDMYYPQNRFKNYLPAIVNFQHLISFSKKSDFVVAGGIGNEVLIYNFNKGKNKKNKDKYLLGEFYSPDNKKLKFLSGHTEAVTYVDLSDNDKYILTASRDNCVILWDTKKVKKLIKKNIAGGDVFVAHFIDDDKKIVTYSEDNVLRLWDKSFKLISSFYHSDTINIAFTHDNYYTLIKDGSKKIYFKYNKKIFPFEQFDMQYNRPDIVLKRIGYADSSLIDAYYKAYLKRLKKSGFNQKMFNKDWHLPEIGIINKEKLPVITDNNSLAIKFFAKDSKYKLDRINVWVNDVPIFGMNGIGVRIENTSQITKTITIPLNKGKNKIQFSVYNNKAVESYKETIYTDYTPEKHKKPDLYFVAIGISEYENPFNNLTYADKDAKDLIELFSKHTDSYEKIHIIPLLNLNATRKNILSVKDSLLKTKPDDQVIIFYAGHGIFGEDNNYYLANTDIKNDDVIGTALAYDDFEALLDSIPARKKLLFIDACHSGEADNDTDTENYSNDEFAYDNQIASGYENDDKKRNLKIKHIKRTVFKNSSKISKQNSFELMKYLFADLRRGTGATIISSAGAGEYALEGGDISNGIFTYTVIEALQNNKSDKNKDGIITVSELRDYVFYMVSKRTGGKQSPTARRENLAVDFRIW